MLQPNDSCWHHNQCNTERDTHAKQGCVTDQRLWFHNRSIASSGLVVMHVLFARTSIGVTHAVKAIDEQPELIC